MLKLGLLHLARFGTFIFFPSWKVMIFLGETLKWVSLSYQMAKGVLSWTDTPLDRFALMQMSARTYVIPIFINGIADVISSQLYIYVVDIIIYSCLKFDRFDKVRWVADWKSTYALLLTGKRNGWLILTSQKNDTTLYESSERIHFAFPHYDWC